MALAGGFVETWGRDYTPTLKHYVKAFGIEWGPHGLDLGRRRVELVLDHGQAVGDRRADHRRARHPRRVAADAPDASSARSTFEFGTMLSFAIPGTVIGVSYILAFNVPPIEITGTALILVVCNVFRNMPVGVRAGMASMAQIDRSLDEASTTLRRARLRRRCARVLLPLLKPAIVAALVYSFVRAMTTVRAVIFLVSAEYEWATTYIINRVVNGDYGVAIAYSSVLIVLMLLVIWLIQRLVGERRLGRRAVGAARRGGVGELGGTAA